MCRMSLQLRCELATQATIVIVSSHPLFFMRSSYSVSLRRSQLNETEKLVAIDLIQ